MIKYPMFGQDSIPQRTSQRIALFATAIFWIIFLICSIFVKPENKKTKYNTVQIVLANNNDDKKNETAKAESAEKISTPIQNESPSKVSESVSKTVAKQPTQKTVAKSPTKPVEKTTVQKPVAKQPTPKTVNEPVQSAKKVQEQTYARDYSDGFDFDSQPTVAKKTPVFDWDDFEDDSENSSQISQSNSQVVKANNSFEVSKKSVSDYSNDSISSTSNNNSQNQSATSESTSKALDRVASTSVSANKGSNTKIGSDTDFNSNFTFRSGEARRLINPNVPEIIISKENQNKITVNNIQVFFDITPNGTVLVSTIETKPSQPDVIMKEIKEQVGKWQFSSGSENAKAIFPWKIQYK